MPSDGPSNAHTREDKKGPEQVVDFIFIWCAQRRQILSEGESELSEIDGRCRVGFLESLLLCMWMRNELKGRQAIFNSSCILDIFPSFCSPKRRFITPLPSFLFPLNIPSKECFLFASEKHLDKRRERQSFSFFVLIASLSRKSIFLCAKTSNDNRSTLWCQFRFGVRQPFSGQIMSDAASSIRVTWRKSFGLNQ